MGGHSVYTDYRELSSSNTTHISRHFSPSGNIPTAFIWSHWISALKYGTNFNRTLNNGIMRNIKSASLSVTICFVLMLYGIFVPQTSFRMEVSLGELKDFYRHIKCSHNHSVPKD